MEEDISKIHTSKNGRDLEVLFLPADLRAGRSREGAKKDSMRGWNGGVDVRRGKCHGV